MEKRAHFSSHGIVYYWKDYCSDDAPWLVMLPGLTADHNLFKYQTEYFSGKVNVLVWDPPAHGESRPWRGDQDITRTANILHDILSCEDIKDPILIGQSMGGYLSQVYMECFPGEVKAFVSVDSCPLKSTYYMNWELTALEHTYWMYKCIPWNMLTKWAAWGCATTQEGKDYMLDLINTYEQDEYCRLADDGYRALAQAIRKNLSYQITCPLLVLCGTEDAAGSAKRYNKEWERREGIKLVWINGAGHNSTIDKPGFVNSQIEKFTNSL